MGIVFFLMLPTFFVLGLLLIPIGIWQRSAQAARGTAAERVWPRIDLNNPRHRNIAFIVTIATFVNVLIVSLAAYSGVALPGLQRVLRPGLPHGHGAGVRRVPGRRALARRLRAVPHRPGRAVVRAGQDLRPAAGRRGDAEHVLAADSRRRCTTCARRAKPASSATGRRSSTATRSRSSASFGDDETNTESDDDAPDPRRRRQRQALHRHRHPLAHERRQRRRVHRHRTTSGRSFPGCRSRTRRATSASTSRTA